jgi:hypothetical protein
MWQTRTQTCWRYCERSTRRGSKDTKKIGERQATRKATNLPAKTATKQKNKSKNYRGNRQAWTAPNKAKKLHLEHHTTQPATPPNSISKWNWHRGKRSLLQQRTKSRNNQCIYALYICYMTTLVPLYFYIMHSNSGIVVTKIYFSYHNLHIIHIIILL